MLKQPLESHSSAIRGSKRLMWRWLGPAAALAFSAANLLVPAAALAAGTLTLLSPNSGTTGTSVTVTGTGFTASEAVTGTFAGGAITWTSGTNVSGSTCTTSSGSFSCAFTVASQSTTGLKAVAVTGATSGAATNTENFNYTVSSTATPTVTASTYSPSVGTSVTLTATMSPTTATGTVTFNETTPVSGAVCTTVTLSSGVATCVATLSYNNVVTAGQIAMPTGYTSASITATYNPDSTSTGTGAGYSATTSSAITLSTTGIGTVYASSLSASGTPNPSAPGTAVTITSSATTTSSGAGCYYPLGSPTLYCPGSSYASGVMWFQDSLFPQGPICAPTAVTSSGTNAITGTCTYSFTTAGAHTITVNYCPQYPTTPSGSFYYIQYQCTVAGGTIGSYTQNVNNTVASTTTLTANPTSATAGQNITFTAAVSGSGGTPTGTVTVTENSLARCTISLASGSGTCQAAVSEGTHTLVASYAGDSGFMSSTSSPVTVTASAGAGAAPSGGTTVGGAPSLPASLVPPPNTNIAAIRASLAILADIPTADVTNSYFGASAVVSELTRPPLATMPFAVGCYSGPNATADEQTASVLFGTKPAGSQFIIFFLRGTRGYSFDVAVGNYCWVDLM